MGALKKTYFYLAKHHESSQATTKNKRGQKMMKFIEERGSPFSADCPTKLHNFVTKQLMSEEIRNDVLNASEKGKKKYQASIIDKTQRHYSQREPQNNDLHQR